MRAKADNWIAETCTTTGTGTLVLSGVVDSESLRFGNAFGDGDLVYYFINDGDNYEAGSGIYSSNTIQRTNIHRTKIGASFSGTSPISLSGFSSVSCTFNREAFNDFDSRADWKNLWATGDYLKDDVVRDGDWTMIANKDTSDRPAPQEIGQVENAIDPLVSFVNDSDISIIRMVHKYTFSKNGWVQLFQVRVPFWDLDSVTKITTINITTGDQVVIDNPILASDAWVIISNSSKIVTAGSQYEVRFDYYNSTAASSIDGSWTSLTGTGIPASQNFTIDNLTTPTVIEISHTDLDSVNRATELDSVVVNSVITIAESGDSNRNIEIEVSAVDTTSTTSTKYTVTVIQNGNNNIRNNRTCVINIDVPITQPSLFSKITNYYSGSTNQPSFANVSSELYFNGVQQAGTVDAYGLDILFQEASVSADWDLWALSGGSGGGGVAVIDNLNGQGDISSALSANQGYILGQDVALRETAATGIILEGTVTQASDTTIDVTAGAGEIVNSYSDRINPTRTIVNWDTLNGFTVTMADNIGIQVIYVNSSGTILQKSAGLTSTEKRSNVRIALVYHKDAVIEYVAQAGIYSNEVGNVLYDFISYRSHEDRVKGIALNPVTNLLQVWGSSGEFFSPGINVSVSLTNANIRSFAAVGSSSVPVSFDVIFADGSNYLTSQTTIPKFYESSPGVATALTSNDAVIHYAYRTFANTFLLQLGTTLYATGAVARDSVVADRVSFATFTNSISTILTSQIYTDNGAGNFNNSANSGIVDLSTTTFGGGGGGTTVRDDLTGNGATTEALSANQGYILDQKILAIVNQYVKITYTVASGVNGGTATSGSFEARPLNTIDNDIDSLATLSSNTITLQPGTWRCHIKLSTYTVNDHQARLQNTSDTTTAVLGRSGLAPAAAVVQSIGTIDGEFTIATAKDFQIQQIVATTQAVNGHGAAGSLGSNEVHAVAEFYRVKL